MTDQLDIEPTPPPTPAEDAEEPAPPAEGLEPVAAEGDETATATNVTEPVVEATEPVAEPTAEAAAQAPEPTAGSAETAAEPTAEAAAQATEPTAETAEAAAQAPEPTAETAEPVAEATEPAAETAEPAEAEAVAPAPAEPAPRAPVTAGRFVADALRAAGVKFAFTVPGESFLGLLDALDGAGIKVVAARHEGAAAFMAEAHGQLTGRPALVLGTRGVGAANMAIGIHTARQDSSPLFAVVGQVERSVRGREAFQEVDIADSFGRLAKWAVEVDRVAALPGAVDEAVRRALSGRPGPVVLALPEDLLDEMMPGETPPVARRTTAPPPDGDELRAAIHMLTDARRPVILAGGGVLRARGTADLVRLAEILEVPVVAAWRRPDVFPNDHRLFLGMAGYGSPPTVRQRLEEADAILVIGCRLNEVTSFGYRVPAPGTRWAQVDLEPRRVHAGLAAPDIAIAADARTSLRAARERLAGTVHDAAAFDARRAANEADHEAWESARVVDAVAWNGPGVHPGKAVSTLRRVLAPEAIVTTDAGNFGGWAARGFRFLRPGTFIGPTSGAMGYALPAAIAAALVHRDRSVVALAGDGGFAMTMAELETAVRERLRLVAIVFDNQRYGTIRAHQEQRGTGRGVGTELGAIDFAAVAEAVGANGVHVDEDDAFEPALRQALLLDRPSVLHVTLDRRWVSVNEPPAEA